MPQQSTSEFVELVLRSGLVEEGQLTHLLDQGDEPEGGSGVICSRLINAGLLTSWQSEQLLSGRYHGFFLGKYKILDRLGKGGMSSVFLAEHLQMQRRVAIKVLTGRLAERPEYLDRFRHEARAAARVDHPNIVRAYDVGQEANIHYLVMEYIVGSDLQQIVAEKGRLVGRLAAEYIRQAALGLSHVHKSGLVHRDIKPANLLVDRQGTVKIVDLGLARLPDETHQSLSADDGAPILGTIDYLAPEQSVNSDEVTASADIYSLGCTLYFLLTGQPPFPTGTLVERVRKHRTQEPQDIFRLRPDAPSELVAICEGMMAKQPKDRFQSADEIVEILSAWLDGRTSTMLGRMALRHPVQAVPVRADDDEELTLAPLYDEPSAKNPPAQGRTAAAPQAAPAAEVEKQRAKPQTEGEPTKVPSPTPLPDLAVDLAPLPSNTLSLLEQAAAAPTESPLIFRTSAKPSGWSSIPHWLWGVIGTAAAGLLILILWMIVASLLR